MERTTRCSVFSHTIATARRPANARRCSCGFTLVELIVVIGIIIFLVGLTVTVTASAVRNAEARQTETTLRLLDMAVTEWEMQSGRKLTWRAAHNEGSGYSGVTASQADVNFDTPEILIITEVLDTIERVSASQDILARIDPQFTHRYKSEPTAPWLNPVERSQVETRFIGSLTVLDAWGHPIYATHPGRLYDPRNYSDDPTYYSRDDDGTIRTYNEMRYGAARNRRICFVAAGPDGEFGYISHDPDSTGFKQTLDNLYSYTPDVPESP